jgi:outer membrane protein OmpA-like peptidoglycan-associated protein
MRRPATGATEGKRAAVRLGVVGATWACLVALGLGGCAPRQTIILVPDPDGRVGEAEVTTAGGKQVLTKASDMTRVGGASAPSAVTTADPAFIRTTFAEAIAVEPAAPDKYVLYFESGSTALDAKSLAALPDIAAAARRRSAISISISGHTDATGADPVNEKLALARAERVKALLLEQGLAPGPMSVSSHGKGNPAVPTPDGVPEPRNRRVEVVVQ